MPNWCSNQMEVTGPPDERQRFLAAITTDNEDEEEKYRILESLVPMPEALLGTAAPSPDSPAPHPNWAVWLASGEITQERHNELVSGRRKAYDTAQQALAANGFTDWHAWQAANWGVKWGDSSTVVEVNDDSIVVSFDTPWGSPTEGLKQVSVLFPTLTFLVGYNEGGAGILGAACFRNGDVERAAADYPGGSEDDEDAGDGFCEAQMEKAERRLTSLMESLR